MTDRKANDVTVHNLCLQVPDSQSFSYNVIHFHWIALARVIL